MVEKKGLWAAVRKTEGKEWIDRDTIDTSFKGAKAESSLTDEVIPGWAKDNPVVRVVPIVVKEVSNDDGE